MREEFFEELTEEYEELRHEHYDSLKVRRLRNEKERERTTGPLLGFWLIE